MASQSNPSSDKPLSPPVSQQFSSLQPRHTSRQMRQYVLDEAELDSISLLNTAASWCFSAASGVFLFGVGVVVSVIIDGSLTEKGEVMVWVVVPAAFIFASALAIVGWLAWKKKRSVLSALKGQSLDIDQTSLISAPSIHPTPSEGTGRD